MSSFREEFTPSAQTVSASHFYGCIILHVMSSSQSLRLDLRLAMKQAVAL
jgi:hypothetical protein